ncbi:hypothetical protein H5410_047289 [Solanum commersonii]|uniref:Uncharacterized protein n=1 Tax=Solanum commersonii TaxID=4109 RepID=A0A9J5XGT9_SOLCO|nr:hypothetical protein H5410_047289 [Solanum commersonii]
MASENLQRTGSCINPEECGRFWPFTACALLASIGEAMLDPAHPSIYRTFNPGLLVKNTCKHEPVMFV